MDNVTELPIPAGTEPARRVAFELAGHALEAKVTSRASFSLAGDFLRKLKTAQKTLEEKRVSITGPLNDSLRRINDLFRAPAKALTEAEQHLKLQMAAFETAQRQEEERQRREAEEKARQEREALEERARSAAAKGRTEQAQELSTRASAVVAEAPALAPARAAGIAFGEEWKFWVDDPNLVPDEFWILDQAKIGRVVRALKGDAKIPGVRIWSEPRVSARSS